ncbi:MAG: NAD(P)/FAD-dependent oxidoreductase [archaeon]
MDFNEEFDVIIAGGGPAGLRAAIKCAEKKLKTVLFEKDQEIGSPVRCGEGLGIGWFNRLGIEPKPEFAVHPINGAVLYAPSGKQLVVRFDKISGYIIERRIFEKHLAREASSKGARIIAKATVTDVLKENNKVTGVKVLIDGKEIEVKSKVVVAADGIESVVARKAGLNTVNSLYHVDSGYQYEMAGVKFEHPDLISLFFSNKYAPRGYAWLFPKGNDYANVGVGILGSDIKTAKKYLDEWLETQPGLKNGSRIVVNAGCIPVGGFLEKMTLNGFIAVGDAAHQVNPIHGGGMGIAMEAADIAAEVISEAKQKNDFSDTMLSAYTTRWYEKRGNSLKGVLKKRKMLESVSDKDFEVLVNSLTGEDVLKVMHGDMLESAKVLTKKLVKNPKLALVLVKYLT